MQVNQPLHLQRTVKLRYSACMSDDIPANERYIISGSKRLRCGFTTGTCAALAAQAATIAAITGTLPESVTLRTPKGWLVHASPIKDTRSTLPTAKSARCGIQKDAGDDPDVTDGCIVYATVTLQPHAAVTDARECSHLPYKSTDAHHAAAAFNAESVNVSIDGGKGVGRVTKAGLDQKPGEAAINSVPRAMITEAVRAACEQLCFYGSAQVVIDVPEGETLAARTFNPQLGITGGISILGTSGVVEPMSETALIETIDTELRVRAHEQGCENVQQTAPETTAATAEHSFRPLIITPGNYGTDFIAAYSALSALPCVKCSNFVGEAIDRAIAYGFTHLLLIGHAGKFVKLAGGIMNTHSHVADCRMELLCAHAAVLGAPQPVLKSILECATVDAALDELDAEKQTPCSFNADAVMKRIIQAAQTHIAHRAVGCRCIGVLMFTNQRGIVGMSEEATMIIEESASQA